MKYNSEISETARIKDQYQGFLHTNASKFWSDPKLKMFEFPIPKDVDVISNEFHIRKNTLLGKRAEAFFLKAIASQNRYEILASQIQLIEKGITLGELDFILKDKVADQIIHVELSYKFYLFDSNSTPSLNHWVGPNKRDSLSKKWNKLRDSQFPNIYTPTGIEILKSLHFQPEEIHQAVYMPLQLFLPFGKRVEVDTEFLPCVTGEWMGFNEFKIKDWAGHEFFIPEKQDWFVNPEKCEYWYNKDEVIPLLKDYIQAKNSRMVWIKLPDNERSKIFVTFWE